MVKYQLLSQTNELGELPPTKKWILTALKSRGGSRHLHGGTFWPLGTVN